MKFTRTFTALSYGLFWLTFAAMLTAMFGMRGSGPQHFVTTCAALIFAAGLTRFCFRFRSRKA